jgi:hypothetical protein
MAETAKIVECRRLMSANPARKGQFDTLVIYSIGGATPRAVRLEADSPTEAAVITAIKADRSAMSALVGKELPLT